MSTLRRLFRGWLAIVLLAGIGPLRAELAEEYELKAAFLYNFALFTHWPGETAEPFTLCLYGPHRFGDALRQLDGKTVHDIPLSLQFPQTAQEARTCQVLFFNPDAVPRAAELLEALRAAPVLTISDHPVAWPMGTMIVLAVDPQRVVFDINTRRARQAGLDFSAKLLRLARTVH
ncbi:MAG TPA: YfiR family protein [Methylococcaceae bacterium]|nr:YfiR family protein [Methylococcaceae bacterium]